MDFYPRDMTVKNLFKTFSTFIIPAFQRDYTWDELYYSRFINDILEGMIVENDGISINTYFIGTMVFSGQADANSIDVVDGQQRLTVLTIIFSVIAQKLREIGEKGLADATFKYVKDVDDHNEPIKHLMSSTSYPYFDCYVQSKEKSNFIDAKTEEEINIKKTYDFFEKFFNKEYLFKQVTRFNDIEYSKILVAMRDQLLATKIIAIITPDKNSAYMIFEILNAKAKSLASIDLIKNIILQTFHGDSGLGGVIEKKWEETKEHLRERNNNIGLATFYKHFWLSKYQKVTNDKLYDSFKAKIRPKGKDRYLEFIEELHNESRFYIQVISPRIEDYNDRQEYKWLVQSLWAFNDVFGVVQTRIALLALLDAKRRDVLSMRNFKKCVNFIENFVFAYTSISKKQANIYENRFSGLAIDLRESKCKSKSNEIIKKYLYDGLKDKFPTFEDFEENFTKLTYTKKNNSTNVLTKYILNKISQSYSERDFFWDDSSIEHINNESEENPDTLTIGNLICLETSLNGKADNLDFNEKVLLYKKSRYKQVQSFVCEYNEFDLASSRRRASDLAKYYYNEILNK